MTKNPFDQFSKQFFEEFLSTLGEVRINYEIPGEPKFVDIWFIPSNLPTDGLSELGILARIAQNPCLIEPFRKQPKLKFAVVFTSYSNRQGGYGINWK